MVVSDDGAMRGRRPSEVKINAEDSNEGIPVCAADESTILNVNRDRIKQQLDTKPPQVMAQHIRKANVEIEEGVSQYNSGVNHKSWSPYTSMTRDGRYQEVDLAVQMGPSVG